MKKIFFWKNLFFGDFWVKTVNFWCYLLAPRVNIKLELYTYSNGYTLLVYSRLFHPFIDDFMPKNHYFLKKVNIFRKMSQFYKILVPAAPKCVIFVIFFWQKVGILEKNHSRPVSSPLLHRWYVWSTPTQDQNLQLRPRLIICRRGKCLSFY